MRIETARLVLRTPGEADLPGYLAYRNDPGSVARQHMAVQDEAEARGFLRDQAALPAEATGWRMLAVEEKGVSGIVGEVGVLLPAVGSDEGNVGWWLHPSARGRGIATEAARGLLGWCFGECQLRRVTAGCLADNAGSLAVMLRLGMRIELRSKQSKRLGEAWFDEIGCAMLREEWRGG